MWPGIAIVITVLGITLVGESMNDLNDPRLRLRRKAGSKTATAQTAEAAQTTEAAPAAAGATAPAPHTSQEEQA